MSFTLALKLVMSTYWKRSCFHAQSLHPFADKKTCHWSKHNDCAGPHSVLQGLYVPLPVWYVCRGRGGDWVVRNGKEGCMQGRWWESDTGWRMWETFYLRKRFLWPKRVAFWHVGRSMYGDLSQTPGKDVTIQGVGLCQITLYSLPLSHWWRLCCHVPTWKNDLEH